MHEIDSLNQGIMLIDTELSAALDIFFGSLDTTDIHQKSLFDKYLVLRQMPVFIQRSDAMEEDNGQEPTDDLTKHLIAIIAKHLDSFYGEVTENSTTHLFCLLKKMNQTNCKELIGHLVTPIQNYFTRLSCNEALTTQFCILAILHIIGGRSKVLVRACHDAIEVFINRMLQLLSYEILENVYQVLGKLYDKSSHGRELVYNIIRPQFDILFLYRDKNSQALILLTLVICNLRKELIHQFTTDIVILIAEFTKKNYRKDILILLQSLIEKNCIVHECETYLKIWAKRLNLKERIELFIDVLDIKNDSFTSVLVKDITKSFVKKRNLGLLDNLTIKLINSHCRVIDEKIYLKYISRRFGDWYAYKGDQISQAIRNIIQSLLKSKNKSAITACNVIILSYISLIPYESQLEFVELILNSRCASLVNICFSIVTSCIKILSNQTLKRSLLQGIVDAAETAKQEENTNSVFETYREFIDSEVRYYETETNVMLLDQSLNTDYEEESVALKMTTHEVGMDTFSLFLSTIVQISSFKNYTSTNHCIEKLEEKCSILTTIIFGISAMQNKDYQDAINQFEQFFKYISQCKELPGITPFQLATITDLANDYLETANAELNKTTQLDF